MNIDELDKAIRELENKFKSLNESIAPAQEKINSLEKETGESETAYRRRMEEIRRAFQEEQAKREEEKLALRQEMWKVQSEASSVQIAIRKLEEQHAAAIKEMAANERMEKLYADLKGWFEESPWSAHIKDFQKEDVLAAVAAYDEGKRGILNANVMGAGKTFEAGAIIDILRDRFYEQYDRKPSILWLTRKSLVRSTAQELMQWNPDRKFVPIEGVKDMRENMLELCMGANLPAIANYELLNSTPKARDYTWDILIMDESHKLKGGTDVKLFHHTVEIAELCRFFLLLSGSPIQNKPADIWPVFHILQPDRFPSVRRFENEFTHEYWDEKKLRMVGGVNEKRLIEVMKGQVIKQDPKLVQASWPDKRRIFKVVEMEGEQRAVYNKVKQGILDGFKKKAESDPNMSISITAIIAQLTYLRQVNVFPGGVTVQNEEGTSWSVDCDESAKLDEAENLIEELTGEGEQVVVWSAQFNQPLFELQRRLNENFPELTVATMTGQTPDADRHGNEEKFQQGQIDVLLCNRGAFSEGFNFQKNPGRWPGGASKAIFLDAWWNPKANEQAEDRIWRTGQSDNVDIYYIYTDDSVDAFIAAKLDEKEAMIKGIMDSDQLRPSDVIGLLEDLL